ncbi:TPA: adenosine deaminase [Clostridioides difficile]|uniref:adenosine deaminase n=1 Tax=Clostridioides difficile TaxID=1496 RepID=UPI0014426C1B|nr:adenosine deaminase [Clostridioides difficile]MCP8340099.1 adenosine deaminase [Clostridioides difficile]MCP8382322.1 adenosine deaminase [Clostridioides difficile]MCP8385743.1 adenosine deaminase [Clostridioides difficile]MDU8845847.1 adenosine deaminase [Clostridioides difficile]NKN21247.1 adenosine deaminase [Clostridioides difficile]
MFENLPKIDLHCHLDGSVRVETMLDIAIKEKIDLPSNNMDEIKKLAKVSFNCTSLDEYLEKFDLPLKVMQSKENLKRITFELLKDASRENVKYIEIRFAPLLHTQKGMSVKNIIEGIIEGIREAESIYDIKGNLILGCMRTMTSKEALLVIEEGKSFVNKGVVAVDLCGPEKEGFCKEYKDVFKLAREYGYKVTIHAGEAASGENVLDAINILKADRIGHGVKIKDHKKAYNLVKDKKILLELCPTSNVQTKTVDSYEVHPFYTFYKDNLHVSINTDNRTVSDINLSSELNVIFDTFKLGLEDYKIIYRNTVEASFADKETKEYLNSLI